MKRILIGCAILLIAIFACSCNKDELTIRQVYDFSLSTWYLPSTIGQNEEVEIRFTLKREGEYTGTVYTISYVLLQGTGSVYDYYGNWKIFLWSQEPYELRNISNYDSSDPSRLKFTLYFKNTGTKNPKIRFMTTDNFGQRVDLDIEFEYESGS